MLRPHDPIAGRTLRAVSELVLANSSYSGLENIMVTGVSIDSHQIEAGDLFVAVAGYGDYGMGYIGNSIAYAEGGYETGQASAVTAEAEAILMKAIRKLLH